eukprot:TRINITY_DN5749_c0_g1_i1.p1 TRINITY_DN5749_c0_g1~~TRINITY_DN5749_c0_g1_i1.p1  ORF type:complete len:513 (+),score=79.12 TRINITY_DN5749_c0_g1_i1:195-1733(+)
MTLRWVTLDECLGESSSIGRHLPRAVLDLMLQVPSFSIPVPEVFLESVSSRRNVAIALGVGLVFIGVRSWRNRLRRLAAEEDERNSGIRCARNRVQQPFPLERFEIRVPQNLLEDLQERLQRARFPDQLRDARWSYGTELTYLRDLVRYWKTEYSWRKAEQLLNTFDHFKTDIDGIGVHFIYEKSPRENAVPLLMLHGWPGSVFEFYKVIRPLTNPTVYGGNSSDAFHVICPSMPGYGFSDAPSAPGFDVRSVALTFIKLMSRMQIDNYIVQGGDWGAIVASYMALEDPEHCIGIHLNLAVAGPPMDGPLSTAWTLASLFLWPSLSFTEEERRGIEALKAFQKEESGYQEIQGTKPQTLGYALTDSPVGLCAWMIEKFRTWSDSKGIIENAFTKDELLTNVMIYWTTGTITSSTRLYCESKRSGRFGPVETRVEVPTGIAMFPAEIYRPPRKWVDAKYNVIHWTDMPEGGHFAAMEQPNLLVNDIRVFARLVRESPPPSSNNAQTTTKKNQK